MNQIPCHFLKFLCLSTAVLLPPLSRAADQDWPTFAHDEYRNAASPVMLELPLQQAWVHHADHAPTPAWPPPARFDYWHYKKDLHPRITFDHAFQVAAVGDRIFYGSSTDDSVVCLDARTGSRCWTFYAEGPVRLAPTVASQFRMHVWISAANITRVRTCRRGGVRAV